MRIVERTARAGARRVKKTCQWQVFSQSGERKRPGGVQTFWQGEADEIAGSKPKFRTMELSLKKLTEKVGTKFEYMYAEKFFD